MSELEKPEKTDTKPIGPDIVTDVDPQRENRFSLACGSEYASS